MKYECKIADPVLKTTQMMQEGYLREGTFEEQLKRLTVSELKTMCSDQSLSKGKKKEDFINIIINEADRKKIDLASVIALSDKGKQYIEEHSVLLSNSYDFIEEYLIRDTKDNITGVRLDKYILDYEMNTNAFNTIDESYVIYITHENFESYDFHSLGIIINSNDYEKLKATLILNEMKFSTNTCVEKGLADKLSIEFNDACMLFRTVRSYCRSKHELQELSSKNIKEYIFKSCQDDNTCETCKMLDGNRFLIQDAIIGKNCPPLHKGCRCLITAPTQLQSAEEIQSELDELIDSMNIPEGMSFEEFVDKETEKALKRRAQNNEI